MARIIKQGLKKYIVVNGKAIPSIGPIIKADSKTKKSKNEGQDIKSQTKNK